MSGDGSAAPVHGSGNPTPLGLAAAGLSMVLLNFVNVGVIHGIGAVVGVGFAFGGVVQFVAGLYEYDRGGTFGMTAFCSYGAFWVWLMVSSLLPVFTSISVSEQAVGVGLLMWGVFTFYMWISTFELNWGLWAAFLTLWLTFVLAGLGKLGYGTGVVGGYVGILSGFIALYVSFAEVANDTFGRVVAPIGGAPIAYTSRGRPRQPETADD